MVEDGAEEQNSDLIAGLEKGDITPNFYEGGFKTWECSIDLAELVVDEGIGFEDRHIIEVSAFSYPSPCLLGLGAYSDDCYLLLY
jgi:protein-histidine N-methyltransferase